MQEICNKEKHQGKKNEAMGQQIRIRGFLHPGVAETLMMLVCTKLYIGPHTSTCWTASGPDFPRVLRRSQTGSVWPACHPACLPAATAATDGGWSLKACTHLRSVWAVSLPRYRTSTAPTRRELMYSSSLSPSAAVLGTTQSGICRPLMAGPETSLPEAVPLLKKHHNVV